MALDNCFVLAAFILYGATAWLLGARRLGAATGAGLALLGLVGAGVPLYAHDLAMQKLPGYLAMPAGLLWLLLLGLGLHLRGAGQRGYGAVVLALGGALMLGGNVLVAGAVMADLEGGIADLSLDEGPVFDAVLVLGGGAIFRGDGTPQLTDQGDRVSFAARLARHGRTKILVASGSTIPGFDVVSDLSAATEELWIDYGVPREMIRRSPDPMNTTQEIAAFKVMAEREGWKKLGLLSSAWHLPRILAIARRANLEATPIPADHRGGHFVWHPALLVPQAGSLRTLQLALWERVGMLVGR